MKILRKLKVIRQTISGCENWPEILLAKLGLCGRPVREVRLRGGPNIFLDGDLREFWGEVFEPAVADVYGIGASDADLVLDVGANLGSFTCLAASRRPAARVYAFEPDTESSAQAERNLAANGLRNVTLIKKAVTADGREVEFGREDNRGSASIVLGSSRGVIRLASTTLECVDFAGSHSLFVKLDCEGAEGEIIGWLVSSLARLPGRIQIACEYHPWCPVPLAEAIRQLREAGFAVRECLLYDEQYLFAGRQA